MSKVRYVAQSQVTLVLEEGCTLAVSGRISNHASLPANVALFANGTVVGWLETV